jgi:anti-sigma B factor antagonist
MMISAKKRKGVVILHIASDMTIRNAANLKKELMKHITKPCEREIDLSEVNEMDTTGVQLLILAKREAIRNNTPLRLIGHSRSVFEAIDTYNLAAYFGDPIWISGRAKT